MANKILLLLVVALGISANTFGQKKEFRRYSEFGIKGGAYFIEHQLREPGEYGESLPFLGTAFGLRFVHMEQKSLGIVVEANYNMQSYNEDGHSFSVTAIDIPLLSHFAFDIGKSNLAINLGPFLKQYISKPNDLVIDKDLLYGAAGGLSFAYPIGKVVLGLEGRYYYILPTNSDYYRGAIRGTWGEICLNIGFRKYKD